MAIRLLALDIDGTLTNGLHDVPAENIAAISRARDAGVFVTAVTGRGYYASRRILEAIDVRGPVVHYGGAWILNAPEGRTLRLAPMEPELVHEVLLLSHELHTTAQLYRGDTVLAEYENPFSVRYTTNFDIPLVIEPRALELTFTDVPKMLILTTAEREEEIVGACEERLQGRAEVSRSQSGFIEINCMGVSKAGGLAYVSEMLHIPQSETAAIGDSYLDMDMLRWAGIGVCMDNGVEAAKQCADVIAPACDACGVAAFIDQYILGEGKAHV